MEGHQHEQRPVQVVGGHGHLAPIRPHGNDVGRGLELASNLACGRLHRRRHLECPTCSGQLSFQIVDGVCVGQGPVAEDPPGALGCRDAVEAEQAPVLT